MTVTEPEPTADERTMLWQFLQAQRDIVVWKLAGADHAALQAVSTPTGLTALGIIRHLTDNERWWFRHRSAGQAGLEFLWSDADPDGDFRVPPGALLGALLADYAAECRLADKSVAHRALDQLGEHTVNSLRWVVLHMIEETARHLGHLDLLREQADGTTGADPGQVAYEAARDKGSA